MNVAVAYCSAGTDRESSGGTRDSCGRGILRVGCTSDNRRNVSADGMIAKETGFKLPDSNGIVISKIPQYSHIEMKNIGSYTPQSCV